MAPSGGDTQSGLEAGQYVNEEGHVEYGSLVMAGGRGIVYAVGSGAIAVGAAAVSVPEYLVRSYGSFYGDFIDIAFGGLAENGTDAWRAAAGEAETLGLIGIPLFAVLIVGALFVVTRLEGDDE
ncbi:hypothetical protein ACFQL9_13035 [Halobaculum lipolyticum]|uniref:Uncharacterized protein n=1 Tax=Halobaculum lipolyticum TaxID=3032001 RepID=A0ABD5WBW8_9EURY